jgi:hypothetical protein
MTHDYKTALEWFQNYSTGWHLIAPEGLPVKQAIEYALQHMLDKEKSAKYEKTYKWTHEPNPADTSQNEDHGV